MFNKWKDISQPVIEMIRRIEQEDVEVSHGVEGIFKIKFGENGFREAYIEVWMYNGWYHPLGTSSCWMTDSEKAALAEVVTVFMVKKRKREREESDNLVRQEICEVMGVSYE